MFLEESKISGDTRLLRSCERCDYAFCFVSVPVGLVSQQQTKYELTSQCVSTLGQLCERTIVHICTIVKQVM